MRGVAAEEGEVIIDVESDPRHAGRVRRYHTWPTITTQSVGEHTWQVMRIMMTVDVGMCTTRLMHYAVLHDVGEMAGDVPWPGKRNDPALKECMDAAEQQVRVNMCQRWGQPVLPTLSETERAFFKTCECLEMWEFGLQEVSMGNLYGKVIAARMLLAASQYAERLPRETRLAMQDYIHVRQEQESETEVRHGNHPSGDPAEEEPCLAEKTEKQ